jgi:hypothetical protein
MKIKAFLLVLLTITLVGCTSADRANLGSIGVKQKVTLYSGGIAGRTWHSSGYINNEEHSDGYYFMDDETHKLVRVSGEIVVEQE